MRDGGDAGGGEGRGGGGGGEVLGRGDRVHRSAVNALEVVMQRHGVAAEVGWREARAEGGEGAREGVRSV